MNHLELTTRLAELDKRISLLEAERRTIIRGYNIEHKKGEIK
jgi:hypothetical protein